MKNPDTFLCPDQSLLANLIFVGVNIAGGNLLKVGFQNVFRYGCQPVTVGCLFAKDGNSHFRRKQ